jgi:hypothetical protein
VDIARGELTEKELDGLITRRHDQRVKDEDERAAEDYPQDIVLAVKLRRRRDSNGGRKERGRPAQKKQHRTEDTPGQTQR